ncbi:helix-turn-helix domain-containing protein [Rhizobium anhuiense]
MTEPDHYATSRAWSWRHAVGKSGLPPITRLVLHTLGLKMDATGGSCYPPVSELVELTGLDKKTVLKHLDIAEEKGWIEVSQHGFRGQKWKRNEYAARWPGRDLTGTPATVADDEGGGAVPPPSDAEKVVEMAPEGGGNGDLKVVEQLHQDKILPANIPANLPAAGAGERISNEDFKVKDRLFKRWFPTWPTYVADSEREARKVWFDLSNEERIDCIERTPTYIAAVKATGRTKGWQAASIYLSTRAWQKLSDPKSDIAPPSVHNPFSRAWSALRLSELLKPMASAMPALTIFQRGEVAKGGDAARQVDRERREKYGWPKVITMHQFAERAQGSTVPPDLVAISEGFEKVHRDSELAAEWKELHLRHGWPWLPSTGHEWLYFPPGEPETALAEFKTATARERGDDDAA